MQHVFIIGSRGLPAQYGGLRLLWTNWFHIKCLQISSTMLPAFLMIKPIIILTTKGVDCFTIKAPKLGPARVIAYDMMAINYALKVIKKQGIEQPIFMS